GIVVTCSPLYKQRELEHQLSDSGSSVIVAANDVVRGNDLFASLEGCRSRLSLKAVIATSVTDYLPALKRTLAPLAGVRSVKRAGTLGFRELIGSHKPVEEYASVDPERDVALLQYTGGTTGLSKGAMLSHYNLYSNAVMIANTLPLSDTDVSLSVLPLFHIYGMTATMNGPLYAGSKIVLLPRFDAREVMHCIAGEEITWFCGVPTMYVAIINNPNVSKYNLRSVKACVSGGAPLPTAVMRKFNEITGGRLVEGYGLSEASPVTHCNPLEEGLAKEGSIGVPVPGTDAAIVDMQNPERFLGPNEDGELAVKGPQVMLGYWKRDDETGMVLRDGWLITGDIARMDEDGYFFIVDRKKDMIDVAGFKVYPREVEGVLFEHQAVKEAAVFAVPDEYKGEAVRAHVVLKEESKGKITESEIIEFCSQRLAKYKVPRSMVFVDDLPKTLIGKVLRRKLREDSKPQ
ncbi:MAG: long-chain fatty acid--CoA ligase, partial [Thaumarchaeota archaeon]|nr:long-chain fatty acid--CoA ligase [Nitrososphaerota archaeon]